MLLQGSWLQSCLLPGVAVVVAWVQGCSLPGVAVVVALVVVIAVVIGIGWLVVAVDSSGCLTVLIFGFLF